EIVQREQFLGFGNGAGRGNIIAFVTQLLLEVLSDNQVVFQNDDLFNGHRPLVIPRMSAWWEAFFLCCRLKVAGLALSASVSLNLQPATCNSCNCFRLPKP